MRELRTDVATATKPPDPGPQQGVSDGALPAGGATVRRVLLLKIDKVSPHSPRNRHPLLQQDHRRRNNTGPCCRNAPHPDPGPGPGPGPGQPRGQRRIGTNNKIRRPRRLMILVLANRKVTLMLTLLLPPAALPLPRLLQPPPQVRPAIRDLLQARQWTPVYAPAFTERKPANIAMANQSFTSRSIAAGIAPFVWFLVIRTRCPPRWCVTASAFARFALTSARYLLHRRLAAHVTIKLGLCLSRSSHLTHLAFFVIFAFLDCLK